MAVYVESTTLQELLVWSIVCISITLLGLGLATLKYFGDVYIQVEHKKKQRDKAEVERREKEEKDIAGVKKETIPAEQFLQRLKQKKLNKYLNIEVRAIVKNQDEHPCTIANMPENAFKINNPDVVSYDHSQVLLNDPPEGQNNYINASYIDGFLRLREYIATQGPRQKTVAAFWHMIWQEEIHCIVMATGLFENATQQCDKYWGDVMSMQKYVRHGNVHVWLEGTVVMAKLIIRTFRIQKEGCCGERRVRQYEMVAFSDENTDPGFLLECRRRIKNYMTTVSGPILVHCRCGGGRTSVYIAIDYCLKQLDMEEAIDVYNTVLHLRKFRKNMVRTLYRFIYDVVALHVQCGETVISSAHLPATYPKLSLKHPRSKMTGFEKQFQKTTLISPRLSIGDCAGGHRSENRSKSRDIMLLPPEYGRPYLLTAESSDSATDFINAVFVDGYYHENSFLVTQWPLHKTVNDIWRLLYDYKVTSLVILNDVKYSQNYPYFWPKDLYKEQKFGPIGVQYIGLQNYPNIIIRAFAIRKNLASMPVCDMTEDCIVVKMFQLLCWSNRDKPPTSTKALIFLMACVEEWQQKTNPLRPVCVMSKDGSSRCGIYCVVNICCDQLKSEGEVDIFSAVRSVKKNRKELIPNVMEYTYCYSFLVTMLKAMQDDTPKIIITGPSTKDSEQTTSFQLTALKDQISSKEPWSNTSSRSWSFHTADDSLDHCGSVFYSSPGSSTTSVLSPTLHANHLSLSSSNSFYDQEGKSNSMSKLSLPSPGHIVTCFPANKENNNELGEIYEKLEYEAPQIHQVEVSIGPEVISCDRAQETDRGLTSTNHNQHHTFDMTQKPVRELTMTDQNQCHTFDMTQKPVRELTMTDHNQHHTFDMTQKPVRELTMTDHNQHHTFDMTQKPVRELTMTDQNYFQFPEPVHGKVTSNGLTKSDFLNDVANTNDSIANCKVNPELMSVTSQHVRCKLRLKRQNAIEDEMLCADTLLEM